MPILVVPMNPEYLPEFALIIAAVFAGGASLYLVSSRQFGRAARTAPASLACVALVFVLARTLHKPAGPPTLSPAATSSMSLVLGDVVMCVAAADRYALSVGETTFLDLDLRRSGLSVTGVVGSDGRAASRVQGNTFPTRWADVRPSSPDGHTLVLEGAGRDIFRVQYAEPRRIEVMGQFFDRTSAKPALISFRNGIRWEGGGIEPGTVIDLRDQGRGRIDFGPSGEVRVRPTS